MKDTMNENHLDFVGDNLAINFINTRRMVEGQLTDTLQSDSDVKAWLRRLEVPVAKGSLPFSDGVLLKGARELREIALAAVQDRKSGKGPSLAALNRFLADAPSHSVLTTDDTRNIHMTRVSPQKMVHVDRLRESRKGGCVSGESEPNLITSSCSEFVTIASRIGLCTVFSVNNSGPGALPPIRSLVGR